LEKKIRAGGVSATIWSNTGDNGTFSTIQLDRSYKDKEDNWKTTNSFKASDIPKAMLVLEKAYEHVMLKEQQNAV